MQAVIQELETRCENARLGGGERRIASQHAKGKLTARERVARFANPLVAASRGSIDDVIMPHGTRRRVVKALRNLKGKHLTNPWKKHDNIPL